MIYSSKSNKSYEVTLQIQINFHIIHTFPNFALFLHQTVFRSFFAQKNCFINDH